MRVLLLLLSILLASCDKNDSEESFGTTRYISKTTWQGEWAFVPDTVMLYCDPGSHAVAVLYPPDADDEQVYNLNDEAREYTRQWKMPWRDVTEIGNGKDVSPFITEALKLCHK